MFDFENELKKLPHKPGVYLMHSRTDEIIYVGKAVDLYNRVHQYFQKGYKRSPKIEKMVSHIAWFEYIICASEIEALVLECNLIKENRPRYNTMLTDDKGYPYIKITTDEDFPRILYAHQMARDHCRYFGPYTNARSVKDTIELIRKIYHIRSCNKNLTGDAGTDRPCLYYQIGQCPAPCQGYVSKEEYQKNIAAAISFLNGNYKEVINGLENMMSAYSEKLDFENAAKTRDLIDSVRHIAEKQMAGSTRNDDRDIIAMASDDKDEGVISVFFVRDGKLIGREHFHITGIMQETYGETMSAFLKQYYASTPYLPKEIILEGNVEEEKIITEYLSERRGSHVRLTVPVKGDRQKLLKLAKDNAGLVLKQDMDKLKREQERTAGAAKELAALIGVSSAERLEAFDISHISGYHSVASMVVFENGRARRNEYRKFKLKTIDGPDDYASMREVLFRRFTDDRMKIMPDILMMDGGKGQVNIALEVLDELGMNIPVCGMVKNDSHRTRGLYYNNREISFPSGSQAFNMITRLQDEAHRFAIEYHRNLRSKSQIHSVLDDIEGIGPVRRKELIKHFGDIEGIRGATVDELTVPESMNRAAAENVYCFFHPDEDKPDGNKHHDKI